MRYLCLVVALGACGGATAIVDAEAIIDADVVVDAGIFDAHTAPCDGSAILCGLRTPAVVAVTSEHLYGTRVNTAATASQLFRTDKDGGNLEILAESPRVVGPMHVTDSAIYWLYPGRHAADFQDGALIKLDRLTEETSVLLAGLVLPSKLLPLGPWFYIVEHDRGRLLRTTLEGELDHVVSDLGVAVAGVSSRWLAWVEITNEPILRVRNLMTQQQYSWPIARVPTHIVAEDDRLYLISSTARIDVLEPTTGASQQVYMGWALTLGGSVAVDDDVEALYWSNQPSQTILKMAKGQAGAPEERISANGEITTLVVGQSYVYWAQSSGTIHKAPR